MFQKVVLTMASLLMAGSLAAAESDIQVRKAELSTMFGSAEGYLTAVAGDILFVNAEKPEMSVHIPGKIITSSSLNEGTVTVVTSEAVHGLSTFHFKLADPAASFAVASGAASEAGPKAAASGARADEVSASLRTFEVRHRHFPKGGCQGRLIVREDRIQFESLTDIGHSEVWRMSDVKTIKRKNPYRLDLNPFQGSGYDFEILRQGMSRSEFEFISHQVADSRVNP